MASTAKNLMSLALDLAAEGIGAVEPNPAVGCVIAKSGHIIGQGRHERFGGPHAEINALADCRRRQTDPEGATVFVTLEPCSHMGKTGPCTEALIGAKPAEVVVAAADPSPHADGAGIRLLREAGIKVTVGVCEAQARRLNAPFFHFLERGRTWVLSKWAQSLDGLLAHADPRRDRWLSCGQSRADAHRLRRRTQAILVGINTVLVDDPLLTPRPAEGRHPLRIVLDSDLRIPLESRLLETASDDPLMVVTEARSLEREVDKAREIERHQGQILTWSRGAEADNLATLLENLKQRGIQQLLVEGGSKTHSSFLQQGLAHEVCVYVTPMVLGGEGIASLGESLTMAGSVTSLFHVETRQLGSDVRIRGFTATIS